ncbi:hypothetical protein [uncultured Flavobacterium sp.]|uniref:hypothetical protein n=1 Tax=uncultured Flavobacterium sp. TaxID=165435 RepID=UPI0030EB80CA|tara:strand:- start:79001 stop:79594 length:594 start_codon:yes stop_codon:yes gene_type:complete
MKNHLKSIVLLVLTSVVIFSCSSDSDSSKSANQFTIEGQSYTLIPDNALLELKMDNHIMDQGQTYDRSSITLSGLNGTTIGTASFDLFYKDGLPVEGTYTITGSLSDNDPDFFDQLLVDNKLCLGWTSSCAVSEAGAPTFLVNANNPTGTVTVINNGNSNYTIQFNGNYRKYDGNFEVIGTSPVVINVTTDVTIQVF